MFDSTVKQYNTHTSAEQSQEEVDRRPLIIANFATSWNFQQHMTHHANKMHPLRLYNTQRLANVRGFAGFFDLMQLCIPFNIHQQNIDIT